LGAAFALAITVGGCGGKGPTNTTESSQGVAASAPADANAASVPRAAAAAGPVKVKTESWIFEGRAGSVSSACRGFWRRLSGSIRAQ
jgi:hypothetical protein